MSNIKHRNREAQAILDAMCGITPAARAQMDRLERELEVRAKAMRALEEKCRREVDAAGAERDRAQRSEATALDLLQEWDAWWREQPTSSEDPMPKRDAPVERTRTLLLAAGRSLEWPATGREGT